MEKLVENSKQDNEFLKNDHKQLKDEIDASSHRTRELNTFKNDIKLPKTHVK